MSNVLLILEKQEIKCNNTNFKYLLLILALYFIKILV